ncbi:MAG: T9SS type A sorting domain-containing protein [Bacteroidota bacterium]|nr:T9SS type A sorting domain-containing protein [Bacteroidota bacterium]
MARVLFLSIMGATLLSAQQPRWHDLLRDTAARFEDIKRAYERSLSTRPLGEEKEDEEAREEDIEHFGRWADFWELRLMPDGTFPSGEILWQELQAKIAQQRASRASRAKGTRVQSNANFTHLGPVAVPNNGGAGRINYIAFHPTNSNLIFAGSPSGGLWKSTDNGTTWTSNTDTLATLGVSAIAIDPTNPQIIYIGTGDRDARDTYGVGILKSTDGGVTWATTGLNWTTNQNRVVCEILIMPTNSAILLAATSNGIWRSTDGGQTWSQRTTAYTMELRLHPTNPNIIFASTYNQSGGAAILRSLDGGVTWSSVWSNTGVNRIALAVSPTAPRRVYALCSSASNNGFAGLYMSLDTGSTWTQQSSSPNILGSNTSGTSSGGQGWFDLCLIVHPTDSTMLFAGGINVWRSDNAGQGWTCLSYWQRGSSVPYVHADQHYFLFKPGTTELWVGNDGGVFRTTNLGSTWQDMSDGLAILQVYRMSHARGSTNPVVLAGTQDNGTNRRTTTGSWAMVYGGDGMENAVDWTATSTLYCSIYYGSFYRSTNSGSSWTNISPSGESSNGAWVTPFHMHPSNPQLLFAAYRTVYRSTNRGTNWTSLGTPLPTNARATYMAVAPSNPDVIVVGTSSTMYRTTNAGSTWTSIVGSLPSSLSNAVIDPTDVNIIWATCSNWVSGQKVFRSTDGGSTWTNMSSGLPNVPVNCIAIDPRNGNVYVGTDIGIYVRQPGSSQWSSWDEGLPNVIVRDLEIDTATNRLYAATYGRGIWYGNLLSSTLTAVIWASRTSICTGDTIHFADASVGSIASRTWTFPGGAPGSSSDSAVTVIFPNPGVYTVLLAVTSGTLRDTARLQITVNQRPSPTITLSATMVCEGDSIVATATGQNLVRYRWSTGDTTQRIVLRAIGTYTLQVTVTNAAGCSASTIAPPCSVVARPPVPTIEITGQNPFCEGDTVVLEAPGGYAAYQWSTGATTSRIRISNPGNYTVTVTDANGCSRTSDTMRLARRNRPPLTVQVQGSLSFCEGDSVVLSATSTPNATFFWFDGVTSQRRVIRRSGSYTVVATDIHGCRSLPQTFTVNVAPRPAPQITVSGPSLLCPGDSVILDAGDNCARYRWSTGDTTRQIVVRQAGRYWCMCTSAQGCSGSSDTVHIQQVQPPTITSLSNRFEACEGDTIILDAGSGYTTYRWNNGATDRFLRVTESGTYSVQVRTATGCVLNASAVRVSFYPLPPTPTIVQEGNTLRASVDAAQYQWYSGRQPISGATSQTFTPSANGRYRVRVTNEYGCWAESAEYDFTLRVSEELPFTVELVPNPAEEYVLVRVQGRTPPVTVSLYDLLGHLVAGEYPLVSTPGGAELRLDLRHIAPGMYVVAVRTLSRTERLRLIRW